MKTRISDADARAAVRTLEAFANEVAKLLPDTDGPWAAMPLPPGRDPFPHWWSIERQADGARLGVHFSQHDAVYRWSGEFPDPDKTYDERAGNTPGWWTGRPPYGCGDPCSINVGYGRSAAQHAKEIARRLLPLYLPAYAKTRARCAASADGTAKALALGEQLADIAEVRLRRPDRAGDGPSMYLGEPWGHATVTIYAGADEVRFDRVSVPPALAKFLLAAPALLAEAPAIAAALEGALDQYADLAPDDVMQDDAKSLKRALRALEQALEVRQA